MRSRPTLQAQLDQVLLEMQALALLPRHPDPLERIRRRAELARLCVRGAAAARRLLRGRP